MIDNQLDIEAVVLNRKKKWMQEVRKQMTVQQRIAGSVPWWLVIIAFVLFMLSAPHTARMFDQLTPGFGFLAPAGIEFGLLYAAFRRKTNAQRGEKLPWTIGALEGLLFLTAIIVNGAGSLVAVTNVTGVQEMSIHAITDGFIKFPVIVQVGLILVPLAAIMIPFGTWTAGEGLADLFLQQRESSDDLEKQWRKVEHHEVYRAIYLELLRLHIPTSEAQARANRLAAGIVNRKTRTQMDNPPSPASPPSDKVDEGDGRKETPAADGEQEITPIGDRPLVAAALGGSSESVRRQPIGRDVRAEIRTYLETNPDAYKLSARNLSIAVTSVPNSRQVASEEIKAYKDRLNGGQAQQ